MRHFAHPAPSPLLCSAAGAPFGFGRGGTTYGSTFVTGQDNPDERTLRHEAIHAGQWARFGGGIIFPIAYLWEEYNHPGAENKYEREARSTPRRLYAAVERLCGEQRICCGRR